MASSRWRDVDDHGRSEDAVHNHASEAVRSGATQLNLKHETRNTKRSLLAPNSELAYLDIETSWSRHITVIGVYRPSCGIRQLVWPKITPPALLDLLEGTRTLFTYNGSRFDLPVIEIHLGLDLAECLNHRDLMHDCWQNGLYGGLKRVEQILGIHRDTEGIDGLAAMNLWERYKKYRDEEALEVLLRYNQEDVENLEILARKLGL